MTKRKTATLRFLPLLLVALMCFSGYKIWSIDDRYRQEEAMRGEMAAFKPAPGPETPPPPQAPADPAAGPGKNPEAVPAAPVKHPNQSVLDAQRDVNPDIVGWLTLDNTAIDYPFVQAEDNETYLHRDVNKKNAAAGTIFMDSRCAKDFSGFNTILYGHHMKNGGMFAGLANFNSRAFFEENQTGTLYLAEDTYRLRVFALMVVRPDDPLYGTAGGASVKKSDFLPYIKLNARQFRDIGLNAGSDRYVTLSTCAYEFDGARMVLIARLEDF